MLFIHYILYLRWYS